MSHKSPSQIGAERILSLPTYNSSESVPDAATNWIENKDAEWHPICGDKNNRGNVEIVETDVQGLVELLTNSSDAYLVQHSDDVNSREELLNRLDDEEVLVEFTGDNGGSSNSNYSVVVADEGCGVERTEFEDAFLKDPSTGGVDKRKYQYLYGEFGQGSLASIGVSKEGCKFVASAPKNDPKKWSWSVTRYNEDRKRYEYLKVDGEIPSFSGKLRLNDFGRVSFGTITKVFNVDSTQTPRDVTSNPFIRRLGHAFPETAVPLNIIDNRKSQHGRRRVWKGMKNELLSDPQVSHIQTTENIPKFGQVSLDAFVVQEDEYFDNEFINSQTRDRLFYTVYGMTHHTESFNSLSSDCGLDAINDKVLLFVDCSTLETPINNIFMPSRTGMKRGNESQEFATSIHKAIGEWDELHNIDEERATLSDVLGIEDETPLEGLSFCNADSPVPTFEADGGNLTVKMEVESEVNDYCSWEHVETEIKGLNGECKIENQNDRIEIEMEVIEDSTVTVCVKDGELDSCVTRTFDISCEESSPKIQTGVTTLGEAQSMRATRGNEFESEVVDRVSETTDYQVSLESNTPHLVVDQLRFKVKGVDIKPDTDVIIHDGKEPKGIVSCKRSLRERVGQTAFWKLFLKEEGLEIPVYLATLDPDDGLGEGRKWRAVAERVLDTVIVFQDDKEYFDKNVVSIDSLDRLSTVEPSYQNPTK